MTQPTSVRTSLYALIEVYGQYFLVPYANPAVLERYVARHRVTVHDWEADADTPEARMCTLADLDHYL